jgi:hypothetical protein
VTLVASSEKGMSRDGSVTFGDLIGQLEYRKSPARSATGSAATPCAGSPCSMGAMAS